MFYSLREEGYRIDSGRNAFGVILQRKKSDVWYDYLIEGKPVVISFDLEALPPGFYRLVESPISTASD
jgi:hypothetical protein